MSANGESLSEKSMTIFLQEWEKSSFLDLNK